MSDIRMSNTVSLAEAADLVQYVGENVSLIFRGEIGIGKSAILSTLSERMPTHRHVYADLPTFDVSDMSGVPFTEVVNGVKVTRFAPNALLNVQSGEPVVIMLDEIGKAMRPVQNSVLRLLHERRIGEYALPEGSIVFGTTNLASEGLGDAIQAHAMNRCSFVTVKKPNAKQWVSWAVNNGVHPVVIAWVEKFPVCLASYMDGVKDNPYIFYPGKTNQPFVSPRSLEKASHVLKMRGKVGDNATQAAIAGAIGESAAIDLMSFVHTNDRLPSWEMIIASPQTAPVPSPEDFAANYVTVFSAVTLIDKATVTPWLQYCKRLPKEYQGVFALNALASSKRAYLTNNRTFSVWATENQYLV
jgi:hypothetical protein